jgi:thiol:disulfide interchange protein DsbD
MFVVVACLVALPALAADSPSAKPHVHAELIADVSGVAPGATFHLGVNLKVDPEWHIYWSNPGETGLPTKVDLAASAAKLSPWHYPSPLLFGAGTPITGYGYEKETTIWTEATASPQLKGEFAAAGKVSWLVCRTTCIPGSQEVALHLPVAAAARPGKNAARLTAARAESPVAPAAIPGLKITTAFDPAAAVPGRDFQVAFTVKAPPGAQLAPRAAADRPLFAEHRPHNFDVTKIDGPAPGADPADSLTVTVSATAAPGLGGGEAIGGVFQFDLLDKGERKPAAVEFDVPLPTGARAAATTDEATAPPLAAAAAAAPAAASSGRIAKALTMVLFAFLGGVILNVMPCVLPVVSIKIFSLMGQASMEKRELRRHGLAYSGGILLSFLAFAIVVAILKSGGELVGWGFQFQSPRFVGVLAAIVFVFGLSLLDVFLVLAPNSAALSDVAAKEGVKGSFFNGVFATVLATPCTAPFLGTAVGFAFTRSLPATFLIFLAIGAGLAFPFLLLAYFPGWTRVMPKPGAWMDTVKSVMGFLLMGTVVWLLDVLGKQVGAPGVTRMLIYLGLLGFAAWLFGRFGNVTRDARLRFAATAAALAIALGGGAYLLRFAPGPTPDAPAAEGGIVWQRFSEDKVQQLTASGKTVFMDFTAAWCWTCKVNETAVIETAPVRAAMARLDVVPIRGDWTNRDPEITEFLKRNGKAGVPVYAVIGPGLGSAPLLLPEVVTKEMIVEALEKAAKRT